MSMNDPLANALSSIQQAEEAAKKIVTVKPTSKVIEKVLSILKDNKFVGEFKKESDMKGSYLRLNLISNINQCGAIKPRFSFKKDQYEKWEKRFLPSVKFGIIIVSTPQGLMTHKEAKKKKIGGRLIAYCY